MNAIQLFKCGIERVCKTGAVVSLIFTAGSTSVHAELPVSHASIPWSNNVQILSQTNNVLHIGQNANRSGNWLLNWQTFNISADSRVEFHQPSASHIALNRIFDSNASRIMGSIDANGRVYLINSNGFIFGKNSKINVNSLLASTLSLNMTDNEFINGDKNLATLVDDGKASLIGSAGMGGIRIEQGAEINTSDGGSILMFSPDIFNEGSLTANSGQVILAAAEDKVYLTPSTDPALRGFLVEVKTGGSVENLGSILSNRGNITLEGMAINQRGTLKATTAVNENGSIRLLARDGAGGAGFDNDTRIVTGSGSGNVNSVTDELVLGIDIDKAKNAEGLSIVSDSYFVASRTGTVTLHNGSQTVIEIDTTDTAQVTDNQFIEKPRIEITAKEITLKQGSEIIAPGANVILHATSNPLLPAVNDQGNLIANDGQSKVIVEAGSRIDVSGTTDTQVEMSRNELAVTLTSNFLRDAPVQRNGPLREGEIKTVTLDIRQGTPLGDISDLVQASVKRGVSERLSEGGNVSILSQGGVLLEQGSEINIAGGSVSYNEGYVTSSQLTTLNGRQVDIADADPNIVYTDTFGEVEVTSQRWGKNASRSWRMFSGDVAGVRRFHQAYTNAGNAGSLTIQTHGAILDQTLIAGTDNGSLQREAGERADGGSYNIILSDPSLSAASIAAQSVAIVDNRVLTEEEKNNTSAGVLNDFLASGENIANWILQITDESLTGSGLSNFSVKTNGNIVVNENASVNLAATGSLELQGKSVQLNGDIAIASGNISISSFNDLEINRLLDVSGDWVNDSQNVTGRDLTRNVNLHGGSISLLSRNGDLLLSNASLLANGGAWLQSNNNIKEGDAGSIKLSVDDIDGQFARLELGEMQAYAAGRGGELKITANIIDIANDFTALPKPGELQINSDFFQNNGFSDYTLISNTDNLTVHSGTVISPQTTSLTINNNRSLQNGSSIASLESTNSIVDLSEIILLPEYLRPDTNLTLGTNRNGAQTFGDGLRLSEGSVITSGAGADVNLFAAKNIFINGSVITQGGDVSIALNDATGSGLLPYDADSAIWFGSRAQVNTQGVFVADAANDLNRVTGVVLDSGDVNVVANRGYIVIDKGARLDVSGTVNELDLPAEVLGNTVVAYERQFVNADAGDIKLSAAEGMFIAGDLNAKAADIEGSRAGLLSLALDTANRVGAVDTGVTTRGRELHFVQENTDLPENFVSGSFVSGSQRSSINNEFIGKAYVSNETVINGGFDRLLLQANNVTGLASVASSTGAVVFENNINLQLAQSLQIVSPIIRAEGAAASEVNLAAPYVMLGSITGQQPRNGVIASSGNSQLNIQAGLQGRDGLLEFTGDLRLQGINETNLNSEGDIRLRGVRNGSILSGSLETQGNLNLHANQVYATTLSQFDLDITNTLNGRLSISGGEQAAAVLSAGSQLTLNAPVIYQAGVIKAPLGQINFNASQQLILADNSLTSVSGEGLLIPYGSTLGEERWVYPLDLNPNQGFIDVSTPPAKEINTQSPDIQMADTAVVDINGGGDIYAWEFVPGIGGSVDNLLAENANGAFAVMPGSGAFAAYDFQYWLGETTREVGEQIYLQGNNELDAGVYTVMPARYALLPGAYLITPTEQNILPSQILSRTDGATIVAGQEHVAGTDLHANLWSGYVIENSEDVRSRSQYVESVASQFFRDAAIENNTFLDSMPSDAGTFNILAGLNLDLSGILRGDAAEFNFIRNDEQFIGIGRGSQVNIAANNLRVVKQLDSNGGNQLLAESLNNFNADSLMLGETRNRTVNGVDVKVISDFISIESEVNLQQSELLMVATDSINIRSGSSIKASGESALTDTQLNVSGDGALVRVSANNQLRINRTNESENPLQGIVNIGSLAVIDASQSVAIDSSSNTVINGELRLNAGSLNLGAARISIGNSAGVATGLEFTTDELKSMNAGELLLTSRSSIDLYGDLNLQLNNLQIEAASINGYQSGTQQAIISANTIRMGNPSETTNNSTATGNGNLLLKAENIELVDGLLAIEGFNKVSLLSKNTIRLTGKGALRSAINGELNIDSTAITAASGAEYSILAGTSDLVINSSSQNEYIRNDYLGSQIQLQAQNITHRGRIDLASGNLSLNASDELVLGNESVISLSGIERDFSGEKYYTPGGLLTLVSDNKNITMQENASIDVSGGSGRGDAGVIDVSAASGNIDLNGKLSAASGTNERAGGFSIDAQTISSLSQLNSDLNANGFTRQRAFRLRQNDLVISAADSIVSENVLLQADAGSVIVSGEINATGKQGGEVYLLAANDVVLDSGALINASAVQDDGGSVNFESRDGQINLLAGGKINVSGSAGKSDGELYIRVARNAADDAKIVSLASNIQGAARIDIEVYKKYNFSDLNLALAENVNFFSDMVLSTLGLVDTAKVHQRKGIELTSLNNININSSLDLFNYRDANEAGVLTLRSAGDININSNITDGFNASRLQQGESWSYNIISGADFNAASYRSVIKNSGNVNVAANRYIRTGSGDIYIASGKDVVMGRDAAIYTAGQSTGRGSYENVAGVGNALDAFLLPQTEFPDQGGNLTIQAQGNISANPSSLLVSDWLYRLGDYIDLLGNVGTTWGIEFSKFKHGVGALGGGDIKISAGGDINGLSAFVPTTGKQLGEFVLDQNTFVSDISANIVEQHGQGDINFIAGGDIKQAELFAANGEINVYAQGNIGGGVAGNTQTDNGLYIISADTQSDIYARGDINFLGANNFSLLPLSKNQQQALSVAFVLSQYDSFYSTYSDDTKISLSSLNGDINIINPQISTLSGIYTGGLAKDNGDDAKRFFTNYPGSFQALSVNGDINIFDDIVLWPSSDGNFSLLAQKNISGFNSSGLSVTMLDISPLGIPGINNPARNFTDISFPEDGNLHADAPVNIASQNPVRIVANTGDILATDNLQTFIFQTNKETEIIAGRDIINISLNVQNINKNDVSLIQAGRDIQYLNSAEFGSQQLKHEIKVNGPGELQVLAGRNIDLGDQKGVVANGNNVNPALSNESASLLIMAGLGEQGADYISFIDKYFTAESEYSEKLINYMAEHGQAGLTFNSALARFKALDEKNQRKFVLNAFSNEYSQSGIRAAQEQNGSVNDNEIYGYSRGLNAIDTLFPGTVQNRREANDGEVTNGDLIVTGGFAYSITDNNPQYSGNISMVSSAIQVQDNNADIFAFAPGGFVNVGLSVITGKDIIEKGIINKGNGAINVFSQGDVSVNQSRIQALNGGDISIWATKGDIDAGKGAKSALTIPPPRLIVDPKSGSVTQVFDAVVQGNGIQTACFDKGCIDGSAILTAPAGVIDAGDAGIRSGGNIFLATNTVVNANQIEAGGNVSGDVGVASALGSDLGGLDVNRSGESAATELVAEDASAQYGSGSVAILQVEVMGLSGDPGINTEPEAETQIKNSKTMQEKKSKKLKDQVQADKYKQQNVKADLTMNN